ncbi:MAG: two-component system cell cycle sensor histidine kinase PleC [Maricaulis maris]
MKFTPEGGRVTVRGFLSGLGVAFQVSDTGIGIAKDDLPRLGRPFEQIESQHSKSFQGSGLGLALSKSLIELHGGTLSIDSVLGEGTTVSVVLPISQDQPIPRDAIKSVTGDSGHDDVDTIEDDGIDTHAPLGLSASLPTDDGFDVDDEFVDSETPPRFAAGE